ncbi:peptidoglycan DD-metalloendopeptidase family protein [Marinactinospora thermotolerans]|uniref:peptidoglycan DD-metalloendopeptidase family protein n=1 Tax=Marinactinospora thermotolerans TaxID=531310 RepID=UPI003D8CD69B
MCAAGGATTAAGPPGPGCWAWPSNPRYGSCGGASGLFGNHVVIDLGDGCYALLAHLRKGSVRVRPGQRVEEGEEIAACGNSGACVEPQVHFQLMDGPRPWRAAGLPFRWAPDSVQGVPEDGVPRAWRPFRA